MVCDPVEPSPLQDGTLLLRPWQPADAAAVCRACQDPEIQRWTSVPVPYREADAASFIAASPQRWAEGMPSFAAVDADSGELLGSFGVVGVTDDGGTEIGYWVAPWARRRGVAGRATRLLSRWLVATLGRPRLVWRAEVGNVGSRRVAESAGFVVEGTARHGMMHRGERVDAWQGSLLPADLARLDAGKPRRTGRLAGWPDRPVELRTPRLLLRGYRLADAAGLLAYSRDPVAARWDPEGLADLDQALERVRRRADWTAGDAAGWAVADADDRELLGGISLHWVDAEDLSAGIGYGLLPGGRGQGLGAEAVAAVSSWAFGSLGLQRIALRHAVGNTASCRLAQQVGYLLEGTLRRSHRFGDGQLHDEHLHARLATDPGPAIPY